MPDQETVRERAQKLWDMAGKPEENDFLREAARQLKEECILELNTPGNL